jgi:Flp pilus assembly protein TadB
LGAAVASAVKDFVSVVLKSISNRSLGASPHFNDVMGNDVSVRMLGEAAWGSGLVGVLLLLLGIIPGIAQSHLIHLLLHFVVIVKLLGQLVLVVAESATSIETHVVGTTGWATLTTRCQVV